MSQRPEIQNKPHTNRLQKIDGVWQKEEAQTVIAETLDGLEGVKNAISKSSIRQLAKLIFKQMNAKHRLFYLSHIDKQTGKPELRETVLADFSVNILADYTKFDGGHKVSYNDLAKTGVVRFVEASSVISDKIYDKNKNTLCTWQS